MTHPHRTASDTLADLAAAITELVDPSTHTERYKRDRPAAVGETTTTRRGRVTARRVSRQQTITTTIPSLLDALRAACVPGSAPEQVGATGGAFESKPPLEVEAVTVYRGIRDDAARWARKYGLNPREPLPRTLRLLVSVTATEDQRANLLTDATRWVREARLAVGLDAAPITVEARCPICGRKNAIVVHGVGLTPDRQHANCIRCNVTWSPDQLGLLAEMLRANREQETMTGGAS